MDQLATPVPFAEFAAGQLQKEDFVLVDVGAYGGVAKAWRAFGSKLRGFGFDPNEEDMAHQNEVEPSEKFRYIPAFVGIPRDHPFALYRRGKPRLARNPWPRLAVARWLEIEAAREHGTELPASMEGVDLSIAYEGDAVVELDEFIDLPTFLEENGLKSVDFLKVDVDGSDFDILQSLAGRYDEFGILAVGAEINYFGPPADTANTFHNIDRFLKGEGFELFDISVRRYPMRHLPGPSEVGLPYPASTSFGRPFQGDSFYARDVGSGGKPNFVRRLSGERLLKLAAVFAQFGVPDVAAEILVSFREELERVCDVDEGLDLLAAQVQGGAETPLSYSEYMEAFERGAFADGGSSGVVTHAPGADAAGARMQRLAPGSYSATRRDVSPEVTCTGSRTVHITTTAQQWSHAVEFPLAKQGLEPDDHLRVLLRVQVQEGVAGLGILSADRAQLPEEVFVRPSDGVSAVELTGGRVADSGPLVVRNVSDSGPTELTLSILAILVG